MNPHDLDFSPGGSSSGSAAAVADFMVPLAIGTQTGGSVIRPAAYCGVVGFKPSFGLFPPAGMRINTETLDTVGIMARSVGDIALFRAAVMAIPYIPPAMPETAPRLGLCRAPHWDDAQPEGRAVLEAAADRLAAAGAVIRETELPRECAEGDENQHALGSFEGLRNHMPELYRHEALLSARLRDGKIAHGRELSLEAFRNACRRAEKARAAILDQVKACLGAGWTEAAERSSPSYVVLQDAARPVAITLSTDQTDNKKHVVRLIVFVRRN